MLGDRTTTGINLSDNCVNGFDLDPREYIFTQNKHI